EHFPAVQVDDDVAGPRDVPPRFPGEPDGSDLAGTGVFGDHAALFGGAQAGVGAFEPVVVPAGAVEAGELAALLGGPRLVQLVQVPVGIPARSGHGGWLARHFSRRESGISDQCRCRERSDAEEDRGPSSPTRTAPWRR